MHDLSTALICGIASSSRRGPFGAHSDLGVDTPGSTRAPALDLLSKYVLDFARHSVALTGTADAAGATAAQVGNASQPLTA